jgi:hypothetical protein
MSSRKLVNCTKIIGDIEYLYYTDRYRDGALNVLINHILPTIITNQVSLLQALKHFIRDSPFFIGAGINECPQSRREMEALFEEALKDNKVSLIAKDIRTDKVIGIALSMLEKRPISKDDVSEYEKVKDTILKSKNSRNLLSVWRLIYSKHNFFEEFDVNCLVSAQYLSVVPEYRQLKVGSYLNYYLMEMLNNWEHLEHIPEDMKNCPPEILTALLVSSHSQKMISKKGVAILEKFPHKDIVVNGKSIADWNDLPDSYSLLVAQKLDAYRGPWNFGQDASL